MTEETRITLTGHQRTVTIVTEGRMLKPTIRGLVTIRAAGDADTIDELIESLDHLHGWDLASEIEAADETMATRIDLILARDYAAD